MGENPNRRAKYGFADDSLVSSFNYLPNDISMYVFLKLPIKSIMRCRCVCKQWRQLFSHPDYVGMLLNRVAVEYSSLWVELKLGTETEALLVEHALADPTPFIFLRRLQTSYIREPIMCLFAKFLAELANQPIEQLSVEEITKFQTISSDLQRMNVNTSFVMGRLSVLEMICRSDFRNMLASVEERRINVRARLTSVATRCEAIDGQLEVFTSEVNELHKQRAKAEKEKAELLQEAKDLEIEKGDILEEVDREFGAGVSLNVFSTVRGFLF